MLQTSTVDVRGKVQDTELVACLRPEEWVRVGKSSNVCPGGHWLGEERCCPKRHILNASLRAVQAYC